VNTEQLIYRAFEKRQYLFKEGLTTCYRLFNMDGDGIRGLTVDRYGEYLLVQFFSDFRDTLEREIVTSIVSAASIFIDPFRGVLLKNRQKVQGSSDYSTVRRSVLLEGDMPPKDYHVVQNGVTVSVDLVEGQNTGLFLDMREVRSDIAHCYSETRQLLNLFCYTGVFSVHALKNGATSALNVDLSKTVLNRARHNYGLNGLDCDDRNFVREDALYMIRRLMKKGPCFDFIIFDPPTFSRNKKRTFSVKRNYGSYLDQVDGLIEKGFILTSINAVSVDRKEYHSCHPPGWELVNFWNESSDFPNRGRPYLKSGLWHKRGIA